MKTFELYKPTDALPHQQLLEKFSAPQEDYGDFYFVRDGNFLLVYGEELQPTLAADHSQNEAVIGIQVEVPLKSIRWFMEVIAEKFLKSPKDGGLPKHIINYRDEVAGEKLHITRTMYAAGERPGYELTNVSRPSHASPFLKQTVAFSDDWLFDGGLMEFLEDIADRYEQGRL